MSTHINLATTPIAPYLGVVDNMKRSEKMALALYLVESLPGIEIVDKDEEDRFSPEEEAFLAKKLSEMKFSPRVERLFEERQKVAETIDLSDERTRHILGIR